VDLDFKEDFPDKIRSLLEEVRWAKDKNVDLAEKVETEEKQMRRTREHQRNLQESVKELEAKYRRQVRQQGLTNEGMGGDRGQNQDEYMEFDQVEMMNRVNRLERDLIQKEKEHKLLQIRARERKEEVGVRGRRKSIATLSRNGASPLRLVKSANKYRSLNSQSALANEREAPPKEDIWKHKK